MSIASTSYQKLTQTAPTLPSASSPSPIPPGAGFDSQGDGRKLKLSELHSGQDARIRSVRAGGELGRRLRDMGLLPGVALTLRGRAPLGDPLDVALDGYDISLRKSEAQEIIVEIA